MKKSTTGCSANQLNSSAISPNFDSKGGALAGLSCASTSALNNPNSKHISSTKELYNIDTLTWF